MIKRRVTAFFYGEGWFRGSGAAGVGCIVKRLLITFQKRKTFGFYNNASGLL